MPYISKLCGSILFLLLFQNILFSQKKLPPPIEWEVIHKADLEMTSFPKDTNATAVILCDYGQSFFNNDFCIEFDRHLRVKILNQNGFDWGTMSIVLLTKDHSERMLEIKGITYNLDAGGNIVKTELDDDDIFKEEIDDKHTGYRFTMPDLKPGCIVDMVVRRESKSIYNMRDWVFQYDEPVLWSEYRVTFPINIVYSSVYSGFEPWVYNETNKVIREFSGETATVLKTSRADCYEYRYAIKDAPAIRKEPFITTVSDYKNKVSLQLSGYSFIHTGKVDITNNWKKYVTELLESESFCKKIEDTKQIRKIVAEVTQLLTTPEAKMEAIYNWVAKSIIWTGDTWDYNKNDVDDIIKAKKGSVTDVNFLLLSLLRSAGIQCDPVILSTRSHGKISEVYPIDNEFNYVITRAVIGTKNYYLDPTDPYRPMDILPERVLGVKALVVKEPFEWVTLTTDKKNIRGTMVNLGLKEDGTISGSIEETFGEYRSISLRNDLATKKDIDIVKDLYESKTQGFDIDSVSVIDKDSLKLPLKLKIWISSSSYTQSGGDMIYFNPFIVNRTDENPFKTEIRRYPVDFGYRYGHKTFIKVTLPENFELKEQVTSKGASAASSAAYSRQALTDSSSIVINTKLDIRQPVIQPEFYNELRNFYSQIVSSESLQLVVGRKNPSPAPIVENIQNSTQSDANVQPAKNTGSNDKKKKSGKK